MTPGRLNPYLPLASPLLLLQATVYSPTQIPRFQIRSYHVEYTASHQNCEVKRRWAYLVLRWGTTWEQYGAVSFARLPRFFLLLALKPQSPCCSPLLLQHYFAPAGPCGRCRDRFGSCEPLETELVPRIRVLLARWRGRGVAAACPSRGPGPVADV